MPKTFGDTYLFNKYGEYNNTMMQFIMTAEEIDAGSAEFADILFDIKRQNIGVSIVNVATSANVKLMMGNRTLPSQFKVFVAKDLRGKDRKAVKVYVDCTDILKNDGGKYTCHNIDILISRLVSAMVALIYQGAETRLLSNVALTKYGAAAYSTLFTHIVDYVFKISINPELKAKCKYLTSRFYIEYVLQKKDSASIGNIARQIAGISEQEERVINIGCTDQSFASLTGFIDTINHVLKINLTLDILVDKWMFIYGPCTVFALEFFPAFSTMLTDAYIGGYINNQKTIEKLIGKEMVSFVKEILSIGSAILNG